LQVMDSFDHNRLFRYLRHSLYRVGVMRSGFGWTLLEVDLQQILFAGFTLSSIYPPIPKYRDGHDDIQNVVGFTDNDRFTSFICRGPLNSTFYFVFTHEQDPNIGFVMKIQIEYAMSKVSHPYGREAGIQSFRLYFYEYSPWHRATAIEYAHKLGF